jgi:hypothetical protein
MIKLLLFCTGSIGDDRVHQSVKLQFQPYLSPSRADYGNQRRLVLNVTLPRPGFSTRAAAG